MEFRLLGSLDAFAEGERVSLGGRKQRALLAELALAANTVVSRDRLVDALWGDAPPKSALGSLQVSVHALRRALGTARIETQGDGYRLVADPDEVDLHRFERLVAEARDALADGRPADAVEGTEAALALWHGPALADLAGDAHWRTVAQELEARRVEAVELRNEALLALGRHELVLPGLAAEIAEHPYRERLRAQQVLALYRSGRQTEALEAYRAARHAWVEELGIEPTPALQELERAVLRHDETLAAPAPPPPPLTRLPVPTTQLVGRGLEIAAVAALLRTDARLVTLVGPGGTGKTRLSIAVAEQLTPELRDGAVFVDLSAVFDGERLLPTIAEALGIAETRDSLLDALRGHVRTRSMLLVLDNVEQLLPAVVPIAELLSAAPGLRVLATSRAPLRLSGEHEYPVPPLPEHEAVQLFAARARAVDPTFALDGRTGATVAEICRRLDGLPLALEIAAARVKLLPLADLLGGLELVAGPRDAPVRQQTLTSTIQWSYDLLGESERRAFESLAVFTGGCTSEAAREVCGVDAATLGVLVDNSLLQRRGDRFAMLETIRRFALDRLEDGEAETLRRAHAVWLIAVAEEAEAELVGGTQAVAWLDRLEAEHDNLRAALAWSLGRGEPELALRLVCSLKTMWEVRGHLVEGLGWLEQALERANEVAPELAAKANGVAGSLAFHAGEYDRARTHYERMRDAYEEAGDALGAARALSDLGTVAAALEELDDAVALLGASADAFRELGERRRLSIVLGNLAHIAGVREDYDTAVAVASEALAIQREEGDATNAVVALYNLASFSLSAGDVDRAAEWLGEALPLAVELGYKEVIAYALAASVRICVLRGEDGRAAELTGVVDTVLAESGASLLASAESQFRAAADDARARLGDAAFAEAHARGRELPVEQALDVAPTAG